MKKIVIIFTFLLVAPLAVHAEEIKFFDVDATINADATVDVVEIITYDFGFLERHGIYRNIPIKYENATSDNRSIAIKNISVTDPSGASYTFDVSREGKDVRIKIGDADRFVTGEKVYVIRYTVAGAMNYFDTHDELYWNVTGVAWEVPMTLVRIRVHASHITKTACFYGAYGAANTCQEEQNRTNGDVTFVQDNIQPGEGVTTVIGMPVGTVHKPTMQEKIMRYILDNWVLFVPLVVLVGMWRLWYMKGRDPEGKGTVVPYYEAPENLTAAEVGMVAEESVAPKSISAAIIQLAVDGYLTLKKIEKKHFLSSIDYEFMRTAKEPNDLQGHHALLYNAIFGKKDTRTMSDLKEKFYKDLEKIKTSVEQSIMQRGYYTKNPTTVRAAYITVGALLLVGSFFIGSLLGVAYSIALFFSSIPVLIFGVFMPQRTQKGAIVREQVLGLKLYMNTAEKDRINFHNAPAKNPEQFEKLLPYAMVLGVEEQWAKQFEDIYRAKPEWYESSDPSFSPVFFAHSMHAFSTANNAVMTSRPSSAGSGGSGFSGGGVGGGFGGGGGGSW